MLGCFTRPSTVACVMWCCLAHNTFAIILTVENTSKFFRFWSRGDFCTHSAHLGTPPLSTGRCAAPARQTPFWHCVPHKSITNHLQSTHLHTDTPPPTTHCPPPPPPQPQRAEGVMKLTTLNLWSAWFMVKTTTDGIWSSSIHLTFVLDQWKHPGHMLSQQFVFNKSKITNPRISRLTIKHECPNNPD